MAEENGNQDALNPEGDADTLEATETAPEKSENQEELERAKVLATNYKIRAEKAEKRVKELMDKTEPPDGAERFTSVDAILEIQKATRGLDEAEVAHLRLLAKASGKPLSEIRKDDNFALWSKAYREKVAKEKAPEPSSRQESESLKKRLEDMPLDERFKEIDRMFGTNLATRWEPRPRI